MVVKTVVTIICAMLLGTGVAMAESDAVAAKNGDTRLILLGTAGGPTWYGDNSPHGISSAVVVNGRAYIVDFGSGAYRQLRAAGIKPGQEAALFFTHLHSDHVIDLPNLLMFDPSARKRADASLQIFGPGDRGALPPIAGNASEDLVVHPDNPSPGTADMVSAIIGAFATDMNVRVRNEGVPDVRGFFEAHDVVLPAALSIDSNADEWPPMEPFKVWEDDNVRVTATLVSHGKVFPNFAYRFDTDGGAIVFSGDTAETDNLVRLAKGADILVHEAIDPGWIVKIVGEKPWNARQEALAHQLHHTHVTPEQAGEVATRAGVKTLVLSHLVPGNAPREHWQAAGKTFTGEVIVGEDLMSIPLDDAKPAAD